ncbi:MAG: hypothetical protein RR272_01100 [Synergistaceae bacterium]
MKKRKAFNFAEVSIAILIIAILSSFIYVQFFDVEAKAEEITCIANRRSLKASYYRTLLEDYSFKDAMTYILSEISGVKDQTITETSASCKGLCPSGGIVEARSKNEGKGLSISCSKHEIRGPSVASDLTPGEVIDGFTSMIKDPNSTIAQYIAIKSKGNRFDINSGGSNYAPDITAELSELLGIDMSKVSWRVWWNKATGKCNVFYTLSDISSMKANDTITVYKYNGGDVGVKSPTIVKGTATVAYDSKNGFNKISGSTFVPDEQ